MDSRPSVKRTPVWRGQFGYVPKVSCLLGFTADLLSDFYAWKLTVVTCLLPVNRSYQSVSTERWWCGVGWGEGVVFGYVAVFACMVFIL
jgi:hypothetical protein